MKAALYRFLRGLIAVVIGAGLNYISQNIGIPIDLVVKLLARFISIDLDPATIQTIVILMWGLVVQAVDKWLRDNWNIGLTLGQKK